MSKKIFDAKGMACPLPVVKTKKLLETYSEVKTIVDNFIATQNLEKLANQLDYDINIIKINDKEYEVVISKKNNINEKIIDTVKDKCVLPIIQAKRALEKENKVVLLLNENNLNDVIDFAKENGYEYNFETFDDDKIKITIEKEAIINNEIDENKYVNDKDDSYIVVINKKIMGHGSEELGSRLIKGFLYSLAEQELLPQKIIFYNEGAFLVDKERSHVLNELNELENKGVEIFCCGACKDYYDIDLAVGNTTNMYFIVEDMRTANRIIRP